MNFGIAVAPRNKVALHLIITTSQSGFKNIATFEDAGKSEGAGSPNLFLILYFVIYLIPQPYTPSPQPSTLTLNP